MYANISLLNASTWFSEKAKSLSCQLMVSLQIQQGSQLARMLGVDPIFYNNEAIYVWVQRQLDEGLVVDDYTINKLEAAFIDLIDGDKAV